MCGCSDNAATCYREVTRRARKEHRCYECRAPIAIGESYTYISGIWAGGPDSFRWCLSCTALRKEAETVERETDQPGFDDFCFMMGSLLECAIEFSEQRQDDIDHAAKERVRRERYATHVMGAQP